MRAAGDTEHLTLEHETKSCFESLGWVGVKIHCHLCSSAGRADETGEEAETRTSVG